MIRDFLIWWGRQLISLVPATIVGKFSTNSDAMLIYPIGDFTKGLVEAIALDYRRGGDTSRKGRFPCDDNGLQRLSRKLLEQDRKARLSLALPKGAIIDKTIVLPSAVEAELDQVLRYEMDVETPFSAEQVYWTWTIDGRDRVHGKISVTLAVIPRARLSGLLTLLRQHGVVPQAIAAPRSDGTLVTLPLTRGETMPERPLRVRPRMIWGACLFLALCVLGLPFFHQSLEYSDIEARIAADRPPAMEAQALFSRLDGTAGGGDVIMAERHRFADPLRVLAGLTEALPDDTFISDFQLKGHKLAIAGQSSDATRLIGILAANVLFRDPSFASPVTRLGSESGALEVFSLTAEVRGEP
jgi:general secretion pathway protein L